MTNILDLVGSTAIFFGLFAILGLSLNLEYGITGIPNFGQVAFQAIGAFVAGIFVADAVSFLSGTSLDIFSREAMLTRVAFAQKDPILVVVLFILSLPLCAMVGAICGYFASYPALRVGEDYLALILLVFSETFRLIARNYYPWFGATTGLGAIPSPFSLLDQAVFQYLALGATILGLAFITYLYCERLENSPLGRAMKAVRENEVAAQTLGKEAFRLKGQALAIGSAIAGIGGGLYAYYIGFVQADGFIPGMTFEIWLLVILGGTANNKGVLVGAAFVTILDRATRYLSGMVRVGAVPIEINYIRYIVTGIVMLVVLAYRPSGIIPEEPLKTPALEVVTPIEDS